MILYALREALAILFIVATIVGVMWAIGHLIGECFAYWRAWRDEA